MNPARKLVRLLLTLSVIALATPIASGLAADATVSIEDRLTPSRAHRRPRGDGRMDQQRRRASSHAQCFRP